MPKAKSKSGSKSLEPKDIEGPEFVGTAGTLRLLRAFERMDRRAQDHLLALIEILTSWKVSRPPTVH